MKYLTALAFSFISYIALMVLLLILFAPVDSFATQKALHVSAENERSDIEETWGIEILGLRSTAADYLLDFRYRVIDVEKALPLFRRKSRPQLIDQSSGATMGVYSSPKTGPLRTTNMPKENRNYTILFANPGRYIEAGNKVTIVIDDFRVENLTVR